MSLITSYNYNLPVESGMFFGRRHDVRQVKLGLLSEPGNSFALVGGRRIGKTSFLEALLYDLQAFETEASNLMIIPLHLDFTGIETNSVASFFYSVTDEIQMQLATRLKITLNPQDFENNSPPAPTFQKKLIHLNQSLIKNLGRQLKLILLLDECEHVTEQPWVPGLYSALRYLLVSQATRGLLKVVMAGSHRFLTQVQQRGSPLRNILVYHMLSVFTRDSASDLVNQPTNHILDSSIVDSIISLSGGHPFLIQYLMYHACELGLIGITTNTIYELANDFPHQRSDFLEWFEGLSNVAHRIYKVLIDAGKPLDEAQIRGSLQPSLDRLLQNLDALCYHGLVVRNSVDKKYVIAGHMFQKWFMENIVSQLDQKEQEQMATIRQPVVEEKYNIHIENATGIVIGDQADVEQKFSPK